ncbi:MAG: hypothetical protein K6T94_09325 [Paenibacillus sp.]|nr:hypothetical protein [Paenibacillus sp.]
MIKNRSFMLGLGSGLLAGALLLQLMITAGTAEPSKDQVIKDAERLNLRVTEEADKLLTKEEWAALKEESIESEPTETDASTSPAVVPKAVTTPEKAADPSVPSTPKDSVVKQPDSSTTPVTPEVGSISLRIPNGSNLTKVADLLLKAGVIPDEKAFLRAADKRGVTKVIQYGRYNFDPEESLDSIIDKLTTKK